MVQRVGFGWKKNQGGGWRDVPRRGSRRDTRPGDQDFHLPFVPFFVVAFLFYLPNLKTGRGDRQGTHGGRSSPVRNGSVPLSPVGLVFPFSL
jgi:hypothetical protein